MMKYNLLVCFFFLLTLSCQSVPREYKYSAAPPSREVRMYQWEGFGAAPRSRDDRREFIDYSHLADNPRVLLIIADTYGNPYDMDQKWVELVPWFFSENLRFIQPENSPIGKQHWHGFGCYSRTWPLLFGIPNVDYVLFRMIDVAHGEEALLEFIKDELIKYEGRVIVSNSWGIPRRNSQWDDVIKHLWREWVDEVHKLKEEYEHFTMVFSSGNSGPEWSGFPQSMMTNSVIVGATDQRGRMADFSCRDRRLFAVAGGHNTHVANPDRAGHYMTVSGTSFSCPTVAGMIARLMALDETMNRDQSISYLRSNAHPSPDSRGFNVVWGYGELEQYNQKIPSSIWRELHFPEGLWARTRSLLTPSPLIPMPEPMIME